MERKIGEAFEFEGKKLRVKESAYSGCDGCFFEGQCLSYSKKLAGLCEFENRTDKKEVIFVEVQEQQDKQSQEMNLCEILRDCPKGTKFYSTVFGDVSFKEIIDGDEYPIVVRCKNGLTGRFTAYGKMIDCDGECTLFPSKEQRVWSKFNNSWYKKDRKFDPNTLQPFDRVLVRDNKGLMWKINIYSNKYYNPNHPYHCITSVYRYCIPYNEETKHLVGTSDEAPEYYRYWED